MLSNDIKGLHEMFEGHEEGIEIDGFGVRNLRSIIDRLHKEALELERLVKPETVLEQTGEVVPFDKPENLEALNAIGRESGVTFVVYERSPSDEPDDAA